MGSQRSGNEGKKLREYPESYVYELLSGENGLIVIRNLMKGGMGFNELMRRSGIKSAKTLSNTLKRLITHGAVRKEIILDSTGSVLYTLTAKGQQLSRLVFVMHQMGKKLANHR